MISANETRTDQGLLEKISKSVGELPPSPAVVSKVMGLTADLNSSVEDLGEVLAADAALTAKVLKLSNSSFYGRSRAVSSLREAILILGFFTLRSLVIASTTHSLYRSKENPEDGKRLWEHSLASALAARIVADRVKHPAVEEIFITGLLHDIGKLVLRERMGDLVSEVEAEALNGSTTVIEIERKRLGFTHADLGAAVLERWSLPPELVNGVRYHHLSMFDVSQSDNAPIHAIVNLGNELAKSLGRTPCAETDSGLDQLPIATYYRLDAEALESVRCDLDEHFLEEKSLYEDA